MNLVYVDEVSEGINKFHYNQKCLRKRIVCLSISKLQTIGCQKICFSVRNCYGQQFSITAKMVEI